MDDFDRFWQWANKPSHSRLTIPADLHHAVTSLPQEGMVRPRQGQRGRAPVEGDRRRKYRATSAVRSPFNIACWHETTRRALT
jgi:hypothetical protein